MAASSNQSANYFVCLLILTSSNKFLHFYTSSGVVIAVFTLITLVYRIAKYQFIIFFMNLSDIHILFFTITLSIIPF